MTRFQYLVITNLYYFLMELNKAVSCAGNVFFHYIQLYSFKNIQIEANLFTLSVEASLVLFPTSNNTN